MNKKLMQWVEIDSSALTHNIHQFRKLIGTKKKLLATVKANAYGHGILDVSNIVLKAGTDWLGVHSLEEGLLLRSSGLSCPVLVVGYVALEDLREAVLQDLRLTVYNVETIDRLAQVSKELRKQVLLHVKIETGTHRQGIRGENVLSFIKKAQESSGLVIEGISSHFADIEDTTDHTYARFQLENFKKVIQNLEENKISVPVNHTACTAAAILFPETYFDMVRVGIGLYGLWPSKETYLSCLLQQREAIHLRPVLSWKARIAQIKKVPRGAFVGYGRTYRTTRETVLAVLPIGYYDGYDRGLSNSSYVLARGKRAPVRGRVAMNFIMVDITDIPGVKLEDEVVLIGQDGDEAITADSLASLVGTINYEIVTRINPRIPRVVI